MPCNKLKKKLKKTKKKEGLPSFLFQSPEVPDNVSFPPKTTKSVHHLGPIFFGCHEYQPMFHRLNLGFSHEIHKTASSTENILRDTFLPKSETEKCAEKKRMIYSSGKAQILFPDPYPHKCPGRRRIFVPRPPSVTDLGETKSTIEGEASQEIPVYCVRKSCDGALKTEYELIELSFIWEKKRIYMSSKERMAHTHFPKQFVTLQVIGPTIPAAITITKLPSKRKTVSQLDLELRPKTKVKKEAKEGNVETEKVIEGRGEEEENLLNPKDIPSVEQQTVEKVKFDALNKEEDKANEGSDHQELHIEQNLMQVDEEAGAKKEENEETGAKEDADEEENAREIDKEDDIKVIETETMEEVQDEEESEN